MTIHDTMTLLAQSRHFFITKFRAEGIPASDYTTTHLVFHYHAILLLHGKLLSLKLSLY